jgi:hypothetical protein
MQLPITGTTNGTVSSIALGIQFIANGTINFATINPGVEIGEIMMFNRILTIQEQEQVQLYLRDKWRYDEWASPVPTPTPTDTPNPTVTPTNTNTPTQTGSPTPSATPPPFSPSGLTNLQHWYLSTDGASVSQWDNKGLLGGSISQGTGSLQPTVGPISLGSFSGTCLGFTSRDTMTGTFASTNYSASSVFAVFQASNGSEAYSYGFGLGGVLDHWTSYGSNNNWRVDKNPNQITVSSINLDLPQPVLFASSGDTSLFEAEWNGGNGSTASASRTNVTTAAYIGNDNGFSTGAELYMVEYLVYNKKLSPTEYNNVINYLKTKYQYNTW